MPGIVLDSPATKRPLWTDYRAAETLRDLREDRGLSQEALGKAIKREALARGWYKVHGAVDPYTIRRIEEAGHLPKERIRMAIALYFGMQPRDIWQPQNRRRAAA